MPIAKVPLSTLPLSSTPDDGVLVYFLSGMTLTCEGVIFRDGVEQNGTHVQASATFSSSLSLIIGGTGPDGGGVIIAPLVAGIVTLDPATPLSDPGGFSVSVTGGPQSSSSGITSTVDGFGRPLVDPITHLPIPPTYANANPFSTRGYSTFIMDNLEVNFDTGKTLTFHETDLISYGKGSMHGEDWINLDMNLGQGPKRYFRDSLYSAGHSQSLERSGGARAVRGWVLGQ